MTFGELLQALAVVLALGVVLPTLAAAGLHWWVGRRWVRKRKEMQELAREIERDNEARRRGGHPGRR